MYFFHFEAQRTIFILAKCPLRLVKKNFCPCQRQFFFPKKNPQPPPPNQVKWTVPINEYSIRIKGVDHCWPNPCEHDGICFPCYSINAVICRCKDGWTGPTCSEHCKYVYSLVKLLSRVQNTVSTYIHWSNYWNVFRTL